MGRSSLAQPAITHALVGSARVIPVAQRSGRAGVRGPPEGSRPAPLFL